MEPCAKCKIKVGTMTQEEASAFIKFLDSEIQRHQQDIANALAIIKAEKELYKL